MDSALKTLVSNDEKACKMETPEPRTSWHSRTMKQRFMWKLRQQWKLLGLFEIDKDHEFYSFTCMLKEGLAAAVQNSIDNPLQNELCEADFKVEVNQVHESFKMRTYAGPVFAHFRQTLGMTEKEYQLSLSSEGFYLQFISNSKSKADFFLTNDKRFFLKTQNKREVKFLLSHLKSYIQHIEKYPHSLLVKFLGVHRIKIPSQGKKYFIVMQSVFYPDERIVARYDIKGCQVSRWTEPNPEGNQVIVVLKDMNFEGKYVSLDQQQSWLIRQMEIDTHFLQQLNVLDYSLLLAFQPLHADERRQSWSFANVIMRTKKSVHGGNSPTFSTHTTVPGVIEEDSTVLVSEMVGSAQRFQVREVHPSRSIPLQNLSALNSAESELLEFRVQNRRLLPNYKNPLHVIDGPENRYFIGIIDIFTVYSFRKKLEYFWKCIRHRGKTFSTVSPDIYASRLCHWVEAHTI
ncbi:phosphatidylinositol 4-phosphate 5-kinase-like protein 1 isoform X2 [Erpetoichthys calabaricus]|uniref:phosphatidylinositol 4-phosphate 5-kinase-like protein 1 isoform X2 n=1 Tax=Erpetoichthys calabaricus TaxID=27687 RepID=UPI002234E77B|nr:phosphatidylinositol 4-phosphate 5-kinase-like protein 1 isoform X2 [Erpetoichthys calabaricus]